jgi:hypothetical protein
MAMLDNLTTQVNLAWDETEIESISDQVEGFDPSAYGLDYLNESDINVNEFFDGLEHEGTGEKSFKIGLLCPADLLNVKEDILNALTKIVEQYPGIKIVK